MTTLVRLQAVITELAFGATPGHRQVGQDKLIELRFRELHENGRGRGLFGRHGHDEMTLFEAGSACLCVTLSSNKRILYLNQRNSQPLH